MPFRKSEVWFSYFKNVQKSLMNDFGTVYTNFKDYIVHSLLRFANYCKTI